MKRALGMGLALAVIVPLVTSCTRRTESSQGDVIAVNPAVVGKGVGATARSAIDGASATSAAATIIARQMDKQSQELAFEMPGVLVQRVGNGIVVTLPEGLLFAQDSDELTAASRDNLRRLATSLEKYPNTRIMVIGHSDSQGGTDRNLDMSERRSKGVGHFLTEVGVSPARVTALGRGDAEPVSTNDTDAGRQWNRRIEIAIYADEATRFGARD